MTSSLRKHLAALLRSQRGATALEYGLILALIVLAAFAGISGVGGVTTGMWTDIDNRFAAAR